MLPGDASLDFHFKGGAASSGLAMIIPQDSAQPFIANDLTFSFTNAFSWIDQLVGQALMIPFPMVMVEKRKGSSSQGVFAEEYHSVKRFALCRPHKPFQMSVEIW